MIFLTSCEHTWDWQPDPYVADHIFKSVINADAVEVFCDQPEFDNFVCFPSENIEELKYNIEQLDISNKKRESLLNYINEFMPR